MHKKTLRSSLWMTSLLVASLAIGCGKKDENKAGAAGDKASADKAGADKAGAAAGNKAVDMAKGQLGKIKGVDKLKDTAAALANKNGKPLTAAEYEKGILSLASCAIKKEYIDRKCPAFIAFKEAKKNRKNAVGKMAGQLAKIGQKLMGHENATVRLYAAGTLSSFFGASDATVKTVLEYGPKEKNPAVLRKLVRAVGSKMKKYPEVAKFVMGLATNESPMVRIQVATYLTSTWSDGVDGTLELAMKMVATDPDAKVRGYACSSLGRKVDERVLPTLKKFTSDKAAVKDPALHGRCLQGLASMFMQWPFSDKTSKKAFDLFTDRIATKKCSKKVPSWMAISGLSFMADPKYSAKYNTKTPWFAKKKKKLIKALGKVVGCTEGAWLARSNAIKLMKNLGVEKAKFQKLHKALLPLKDKGDNSSVLRDLEKLI